MTRSALEEFAADWLQRICEGRPLDPLLGGTLDPSVFAERAAGARAKLGAPLEGHVDELVVEGERIAWRWSLTGPLGALRGVNFQRIESGRAVAHWTIVAS